MRVLIVLFLSLASHSAILLAQGLLVHRTGDGLTVSDASAVFVNDKDKVVSLGPAAKIAGPVNKLPSVKPRHNLLRDAESSALADYSAETPPDFLLPQGLPKTFSGSVADAWKAARITYKKSQADKTPTEVLAEQFVAFLPGGVEGLASLCMDRNGLALLGGKDGYFGVQMQLLAAAVGQYPSHGAMVAVERYVRDAMRASSEQFDAGVRSTESLNEGLQIAKLSKKAYPSLPEHEKLRQSLAEKKVWLDRRVAIQRALFAGAQWDAFLTAYDIFEKHQFSFPKLMDARKTAFQESMQKHWNMGKERLKDGEYRSALRELTAAAQRQPSNAILQKDVSVAWSEHSQQIATAGRNNRRQLSSGEKDAIRKLLFFAANYQKQNNLDDALKSVTEAEAVDPEHLDVLRTKAEVLRARRQYAAALRVLDKYDEVAVNDERAVGHTLRDQISFEVTKTMRDVRKQLEDAWAKDLFHQTGRLASQALYSDERDPDVLYFGALASIVTRNPKNGQELLKRFLQESNTLDTNVERRAAALRLLGNLPQEQPAAPSTGDPNWFSGRRLEPGLLYCPLSLALQARIDLIDANKLTERFTWNGNQLRGITPAFEKAQQATGEAPFFFTYDNHGRQVRSVDTGQLRSLSPSSDPDQIVKNSSVVLLNDPFVDPIAIERVTGKQVTFTVAGNPYFNPFVWQRRHVFQITYDAMGRVKTAREVPESETPAGSEVLVDFDWDGDKLMAVRAFRLPGTTDERKRVLVYERRQQYQQDRLIGEEIRAGTKTSKIKYVWNGAQLVSAQCEKDETLDNRSREVTFVSSAAPARNR